MVRVLIPSGALGLGFDRAALARGVAAVPDIIAIDGGSTDSGPAYLGAGVSKYARASLKSEWAELIEARAEASRVKGTQVPLVIGTAGTCGADSAVDWFVEITREILEEKGLSARLAVLRSSQSGEFIADALDAGKIAPLDGAPPIDRALIESMSNIVALAGAEQVNAALATGAQIVIAGRTTDTAIIAALPLSQGCEPGGCWHGAKIGECGALCTSRPQTGVIQIDFDGEGFTVMPHGAGAIAGPRSVMAHMLYENADPFILHEPGGHLDVRDAIYQDAGNGTTRVTGSRWVPAPAYRVKLEGARATGYRVSLLALLRDPHHVARAREWADDIETRCREKVRERMALGRHQFDIDIRLIGADATFGALEPETAGAFEIGALAMVHAPDREKAQAIARLVNPFMLHHQLDAEADMPTFAFPHSPAEGDLGIHYEFGLHHVMELDDPMDAFSIDVIEVSHG